MTGPRTKAETMVAGSRYLPKGEVVGTRLMPGPVTPESHPLSPPTSTSRPEGEGRRRVEWGNRPSRDGRDP